MNAADRYRRWFKYEKDAHQKVLESLRSVPENRRVEADYQKAIDLLAHIFAARHLWLYRMREVKEGPKEPFPRALGLTKLLGKRIRCISSGPSISTV